MLTKQVEKKESPKTPRLCKLCNKSLKVIGVTRVNGKGTYSDWKSRPYHKKCYFQLKEEDIMKEWFHKNAPKLQPSI